MDSRIKDVYRRLEREALDGLILAHPANISYLTRFNSRDAYLLISKKKNIYITDSRYTEEAKANLDKLFLIKKSKGCVFKIIADLCRDLKLKRIGFEERHLAFAEYQKIKKGLAKNNSLIPIWGLVEELRQIKNREELEKISAATRIAIAAFRFIRDFISPGKKEIEIAAELERFIRYQGATGAAFNIIVASGPNSAFPHHITGQRKVRNGEPLLIDLGVDYLGYKSDLTRIFFLGKINPLVRRIYAIVHKAQARAISKIRPGIKINKIDAAARQYITQKGFGGFFGHNLGHGIGLEIHEEPCISRREDYALEAGMVFTVEPAIYLPGKFGIRIEDMVLVTQKGCEVLSGRLHK